MSITSSSHMINSKILWVLRALMAALFVSAAIAKFAGQSMMVAEFDAVGLGQWFRYFTGAMELAGGVAVLIPAVSGVGALLLLLVDVGAFVAQVSVLHMDFVHPIVIGAVLAALVWFQRRQLGASLGL